MAKYLRPRRGSYANAAAQNISLKKGELFFEFPNGNIGKEPARLIIGDGASSYGDLEVHGSGSSTNSFQPALIHPAIYHVDFNNSNPATASWTFNSGTTAINNIQPRSTNSGTSSLLPKIIGNIKQALVNHADSLTKLNNDLYCHHISGEIDLNDYTETGTYMVDTYATTYTHGPEYTSSDGVYSTLRVIKNDRKINGNLALTQIMIFNSKIFTRQARWVSTGLSDLELSWENWVTFYKRNVRGDGDSTTCYFGTRVITVTAKSWAKVFTDQEIRNIFGISGAYFVHVTNGDYNAQGKYLTGCVHQDTAWYVRTSDNSNFTAGNLRINYLIAIF